jgi:hypothetical protein
MPISLIGFKLCFEFTFFCNLSYPALRIIGLFNQKSYIVIHKIVNFTLYPSLFLMLKTVLSSNNKY